MTAWSTLCSCLRAQVGGSHGPLRARVAGASLGTGVGSTGTASQSSASLAPARPALLGGAEAKHREARKLYSEQTGGALAIEGTSSPGIDLDALVPADSADRAEVQQVVAATKQALELLSLIHI